MIINVSGTSGTGKSHLVRRIMELYAAREPEHWPWDIENSLFGDRVQPRARPSGYLLERRGGGIPTLYVAGHYEIECGGCDTFMGKKAGNRKVGLDDLYETIRAKADAGNDVLYEGLIVVSDWRRCAALVDDGYEVLVLSLEVPLETCYEAIQQRRDDRGDTRPLNTKNTKAKHRADELRRGHLLDAGVDVRVLDREEAFEACRRGLGL